MREELLKEHSKQHTSYLANQIGPNQEAFDELMEHFLGEDTKVAQRAAWVVSHCVDAHPWLLDKHLSAIIHHLQKPVHVAVKRNTVRVLQFVDIPEELLGLAAEVCFEFLNSGKESIAVKAHSMTVCFNIVKRFPELKEELRMSIEDQLPFGSAGFKSRGRKILKALDKM